MTPDFLAPPPGEFTAPGVAIVGGGPAGLMAAEVLSAAGVPVDLFDAMPSVGRKFLLAGKGGLNLTHSEPMAPFVRRFGAAQANVAPWLAAFTPDALRAWAKGLGVSTFVGSSGRVFPADLKAAPLLRAWLHRLRVAGVRFHMRHRWTGWAEGGQGGPGSHRHHGSPGMDGSDGNDDGRSDSARVHSLRFVSPAGQQTVRARAVLLALGGASWPQLGSDGAWVPFLQARGVSVAELRPSTSGFDVVRSAPDGTSLPGWSEFFRSRFAGAPLKTVALTCTAPGGDVFHQRGEFIVTEGGIEGSLVYAASGPLRDTIAATGSALLHIDLLPGRTAEFVREEVARPRGTRSLATHLKSRLGIEGVKGALLHELLPRSTIADPGALAAALKALPLRLAAPRPIAEAISTAGGVRFEAMDEAGMLRALPGVFCAGEMTDWEAPTGGYLLSACLASGRAAAGGVLAWLARRPG